MKFSAIKSIIAEIFIFLYSIYSPVVGQDTDLSLDKGFSNPPDEALPRTWWHWTNCNITKEGITLDLEWMKRSGIGGMHLADVAAGQGQSVEKKICFGSEDWYDAVRHAAAEADRLNLEMTVFSSPGWSLTGGPWVRPEQAMKKIVWSEIKIKGSQNFSGKLPLPPSNEGPIRNMSRTGKPDPYGRGFYKDCVVLAFPTPPDDLSDERPPVISTSGGNVNIDNLLDDDLNSMTVIRSSGNEKKEAWIQFSWEEPFTARSLTIASRNGIPAGILKAGNHIDALKTVAILPGPQLYRAGKVQTVTFPATKAKFFRLELTGSPMKPADVMADIIPPPDSLYTLSELKIHSCAKINRWEDKAGFFHLFSYEPVASPEVPSSSSIDPSDIVDLTGLMKPDGSLEWKVPPGNWTIMRFGWSLTGGRNRPAVPSGTGYEVDKLSKEHTLEYIKNYMDLFASTLGELYGKSLRYVMLDSWEAGMQNWTDNMPGEFRSRRGYDLKPFLPCLAGYVMVNSSVSDRVLWDFRRTLADMFAENHYGVITAYLNSQGIKTYGEASGVSLEILEDALLCKKFVDIPMGEFWYKALHPELMYYQDVRGAASAAHVYGRKIVAAESFTGGGYESPYTLKKIADYWFTQGINRIVFHTSAHQPLDKKPGNTMVGTHINRNITWADLASPFMTYLARNSFMLQRGKFVADLVYLLDEGAPSTMPVWGAGLIPALPEGYDYDYINADALINRTSVDSDGRLVLPDSMTYRILVLPDTRYMTLQVLKKIKELVKAGATVSGARPQRTPGLSGYPESEEEFSEIVRDLWGDLDGISRTRKIYGKGKLFWGVTLNDILYTEGIRPDFEYSAPLDSHIDWIHRKEGQTDIYFIVNSSDRAIDASVRFRVSGMEAELWDPVTGKIKPLCYSISDDFTTINLELNERESAFIVFRKAASSRSNKPEKKIPVSVAFPEGPWEITFPPDMGAPEKISTDTLKSWTSFPDNGIKYFSGTGIYRKSFSLNRRVLQEDSSIIIDLGKVYDIAEININGANAGVLWCPPYSADITGLLKKGENIIEIKVTNQWTNRILGDAKSQQDKKILSPGVFIFPGREPDVSGLTGPVRLLKYSR